MENSEDLIETGDLQLPMDLMNMLTRLTVIQHQLLLTLLVILKRLNHLKKLFKVTNHSAGNKQQKLSMLHHKKTKPGI